MQCRHCGGSFRLPEDINAVQIHDTSAAMSAAPAQGAAASAVPARAPRSEVKPIVLPVEHDERLAYDLAPDKPAAAPAAIPKVSAPRSHKADVDEYDLAPHWADKPAAPPAQKVAAPAVQTPPPPAPRKGFLARLLRRG